MPRILVTSYCAFAEPTNGAAISLCEMLAGLRERGWSTHAVCGPWFDRRDGRRPPVLSTLRALGYQPSVSTTDTASVARYDARGLSTTQLVPTSELDAEPTAADLAEFAALLEAELAARPPDVIVTYGGRDVGRLIQRIARTHGIPRVFWLRNASYAVRDLFDGAAGVLVNSSFIQRHYRRALDLAATVIPSPVRWDRVQVDVRPEALTFITPTWSKGLTFAARIFEQVLARRPGTPIVVAEGRGRASDLFRVGADLPPHAVTVVPATSDPRAIYERTRVLLAPSLWPETFLRSAVEAMTLGIPTIASDRGGIAETLGTSGRIIAVPARFTEHTRTLPSAWEVAPWVDAIARWFDDERAYAAARAGCLARRTHYAWDRVVDLHATYFARFAPPSTRRSSAARVDRVALE